MAGRPGPDKWYVDAGGRFLGTFRDSVDSAGNVLAAVRVPVGATQVTSAPPGPDFLWTNGMWARDADYVEPPPPDGTTRVQGEGAAQTFQVCLNGTWRQIMLQAE